MSVTIARRTKAAGLDLGFLDRPRRHVHRRVGREPGRRAACAQAAVREPGALRGRRGRRASASCSASAPGEPIPADAIGVREDGHDGRHQRAAGAQGRAHAARDHARLRDALRDRLPGRARTSSPRDIVKPEQLYAGVVEVDERVLRRRRRSSARSIRRRAARARAAARRGFARVAIVFMHGYRYPGARARGRGDRARARLHAGVGQPRGFAR